jgi:serine/threonine protein kinase
MAALFKLPSLKKKEKKSLMIPIFNWATFQKEKKIGSGTFGSVYIGKCVDRDEKVVVKKVKSDSYDSKARCLKAALLNKTQGHRNIIKFLGFCDEPHAIMMEHSYFDFQPFGIEKQSAIWKIFFISSMRNMNFIRSPRSCLLVPKISLLDYNICTTWILPIATLNQGMF